MADDIPIVGQPPASILHWWPTTLVKCHCAEPKLNIVILTGFGNHCQCQDCGKLYYNKGMTPDGKGGLNIIVDFVIPTPESSVM